MPAKPGETTLVLQKKQPRFTIAREAGPCTVLTLSDALADDERGEVVLNA
jgi:hypothetical protein